MSEYAIRALDAATWDAFAHLAEKHNGMGFGGCWCTWFHSRVDRPEGEVGRAWKERLVGEGKAHAALVFDRGALDLIAKAGGGVVEGYPQDTQGKKVSASFLYSATRSLFEETGFSYDRPKGKFNCVMRRTVSPVELP